MYRLLLSFVVLTSVASFPIVGALVSEKKEEELKKEKPKKDLFDHIKWETADFSKSLEGEFDLKVKSWTVVNEFIKINSTIGNAKGNHVKLLLEFTKDVDASLGEKRGNPFLPFTFDRGSKGPDSRPHVEFYFFDDENVRILAMKPTPYIDGDITRKKGEAFRVFLSLANDEFLRKTKRIEVHLRTPKKTAP